MWSCKVSVSLNVIFITLSATWIVSSTAFLQTTPLPLQIDLQKHISFGHHHHHHHLTTASKNANNNDSVFDMEELWQRIRTEQQKQIPSSQSQWRSQQQQKQSSISSKSQIPPLDYVYIVTFPERSTIERTSTISSSSPSSSQYSSGGIHSIQYPSGKNVILAFTNQTSCDQFVQHLRQQQFFDPMTLKISVEALVEICLNVGVLIEVIPEGIDILPPTQHVPQFGLQHQQQKSSSSSSSSSSVDEYRQIQRLREKFNFAYYMLDETDDLEEEGILFNDDVSWSFR